MDKNLSSTFLDIRIGYFGWSCSEHWEINHMRPIIEIQNVVVTRSFNLNNDNGEPVLFIANRIRVINTGRTGATGCKVYIEFTENEIERTSWMLPDDDTSSSLTLNVGILEYVDLCAISSDGHIRVTTNEHGYRLGTIESCIRLPLDIDITATLRVASSNARPAVRRVILHAFPIPDEANPGRIVEFTG